MGWGGGDRIRRQAGRQVGRQADGEGPRVGQGRAWHGMAHVAVMGYMLRAHSRSTHVHPSASQRRGGAVSCQWLSDYAVEQAGREAG